jgi:hypothetical protein
MRAAPSAEFRRASAPVYKQRQQAENDGNERNRPDMCCSAHLQNEVLEPMDAAGQENDLADTAMPRWSRARKGL